MTDINRLLSFPDKHVILDAEHLLDLHHLPVPPTLTIIIRNPKTFVTIQKILAQDYPLNHELELFIQNQDGSYRSQTIALETLASMNEAERAAALLIPPIPENRSFEYFQNVVATLRAPGGCPWDRKQTHQSLRDDFLQEAYELLDGLDRLDLDTIREELGDVLLHVVIQAQIAQESAEFNMGDVLSTISEKLIFRHEHVFGKAEQLNAEDVISRWEQVKLREREKENKSKGLLEGISIAMPALSMAFSFQKRAAKAGFDWDSADQIWPKLYEEIEEFKRAETAEGRFEELGDILFTLVNLARRLDIDPETALRTSNLKFQKRVEYVEKRAAELGKNLFEMPLSEKDRYWDEYKRMQQD